MTACPGRACAGSAPEAETRNLCHKTRFNRIRLLLTVLLLALLCWQWGQAFAIAAKAELAQVLIERAWQQTLAAPDTPAAPWPWADTRPVARLQWLDQSGKVKRDLYVLSGAHGSALAFGPGLMDGLGQARLVGGHRDTHFAFMQHLQKGDRLRWQHSDGQWQTYVVSERRIADSRHDPLLVENSRDSLWLVTCYPFNGLEAGGPLRYVVRADSVPEYVLAQSRSTRI